MAINVPNEVSKSLKKLNTFEKVYFDAFEIMKIPQGFVYTRITKDGVGSSFFVPNS